MTTESMMICHYSLCLLLLKNNCGPDLVLPESATDADGPTTECKTVC